VTTGASPRAEAGGLDAPAPPTLPELAAHLGALLGAHRYAPAEHGVAHAADRRVARLGLALDGSAAVAAWSRSERLDAVWLHRPWRLPAAELAPGTGVCFTHLPFDDRLTTGLNPRLATALECTDLEPFAFKDGRTLGMLARCEPRTPDGLRDALAGVFGGLDAWVDAADEVAVRRIAVVGAMNEAFVRDAAARGAALYVTGQLRAPALAAVRETGIGVAAVGHGRSEAWGVRALTGLLRERWAGLDVRLLPP
jgi:putative NIF3 family GTP cyclohydrolase 1 type 2